MPDDKDWTWVLERRCPECGFEAGAMPLDRARDLLTNATATLLLALSRPDARTRPHPTRWSPLEYACHVRDTCEVFRRRITLVLEQDDPTFPNWDQDATAVEQQYDQQDPRIVESELQRSLAALLEQLDAIPADAWGRPALRSNGSRFTLATLVRYLVHDPVHHAHDVAITG
ncbi:MAG: maleylpyruvate isomerase N-terminal domain-containing protein [Mycobacteriales bacterium]